MAYTTSPFRKCDYCGQNDSLFNIPRRLHRRAWTLHATTRKLSCPSCLNKGNDEDRKAKAVLLQHGQLLEHRIAAEPVASYAVRRQYERVKENYPDVVLLFRSGDDYVALFGDADVVHEHFGVVVSAMEDGSAIAAFPFHALDTYLPALVKGGHRVAICDQIAGPPVPGMMCEPGGDPPLAKTHRIALHGNVFPVDVHLEGGQFFGLDGSWSIAVGDKQIRCVVLRYGSTKPRPVLYGDEHGLGIVEEPIEQYRRIKPLYKDALLVLRDHQGYLMLYRDAERACGVLGTTYSGTGPFRIAKSLLEDVLDKLVKEGHRVAVVIDPNVDAPDNARQTDLWDAIHEEVTAVAEAVGTYRHRYTESLQQLREQVEYAKKKIKDLEERGDAACAEYDLRYGYNAEFNLKLLRNHVAFFERGIAEHPDTLAPTLF